MLQSCTTFLSQPEKRSGLCGLRGGKDRRAEAAAEQRSVPGSVNQHGRCRATRCVRAAFSPPSSGKCPCSPPRWRLGGWNPFLSGWMSLAGDVSGDLQPQFLFLCAPGNIGRPKSAASHCEIWRLCFIATSPLRLFVCLFVCFGD